MATLTNTATGAAIDKPAFWCDGNIHAAELTASTAVLYYRTSSSAPMAAMRRPRGCSTRALYLCPRLNPDGAELALADRPRHIRSSTRAYPFDEPPVDGLTDGGRRRRRPHPHHAHPRPARCLQEVRPKDARLMVPREPASSAASTTG